jgi:putative tricarboxylic transport membrane protein
MTVALLLPLTRGLDVTTALIMFAGIYYGGMYGGSTTSILLNTPGESASVVTAIEGNKMARAGRAAQALATAAIGSFVAAPSPPSPWHSWPPPSPISRSRSPRPTGSPCCSR